jgi:hypothetical protein
LALSKDYRHCGFRTACTMTFIPGEGAEPCSGEAGKLDLAEEVRLKMIAPSFLTSWVVKAMPGRYHYEEVAYDVYSTDNPVPWGFGRIGMLEEKRTLEDILAELAWWCGSREPRLGAELLVAGGIDYNISLQADEAGLPFICLGHLESERAFIPMMVESIRAASDQYGWNPRIEGYHDQEVPWR